MSASQLLLAKWALGTLWLLAAASFFAPAGSPLRTFGQLLFWLMLAAHAVECALFWRTLRAPGKGLAGQIVQTVLFGILHYQTIKREAERAQSPSR